MPTAVPCRRMRRFDASVISHHERLERRSVGMLPCSARIPISLDMMRNICPALVHKPNLVALAQRLVRCRRDSMTLQDSIGYVSAQQLTNLGQRQPRMNETVGNSRKTLRI